LVPQTLHVSGVAAHAGSPRLLLFVILVVTLCAGGGLIALESETPDAGFLLSTVAATFSLAAIFVEDYRRSGNALSPMCLSAVIMFLLFPFHGLVTQDSPFLTSLIGNDADHWRGLALLVMTASVPFFWLGYNSRLGARLAARLPSPGFRLDDEHSSVRWKLIVLYVFAMLPRLLIITTGQLFHWGGEREVSDFDFILHVLGNIPVFATTYLLVVGVRSRNRLWLLTGLLMLAGEVVWGLVSGSRMRMFIPLVAAVAALSYLGRPFRLRRFLFALVAFALIVFPFTTAFREAYVERTGELGRDGIEGTSLFDVVSDAAIKGDGGADFFEGDGPIEALAERLHGLTSLALIIRYTPERHDYLMGVPYLLIAPQILLPRFVWPDKPPLSPFSDSFRFDYWGIDPSGGTSVATSLLGDLWVNLHLFGALVGSWCFAFFMAFVFRHLKYGIVTDSIFPMVVFAAHLTDFLHAFEGSLDGTVAGIVKSLFIYFLIAWFLSQRRPQRAPVGTPRAHA